MFARWLHGHRRAPVGWILRGALLWMYEGLLAVGWVEWAAGVAAWLTIPLRGGVDTTVATGDAETVRRWAEKVWIELPERIVWGAYMRPDPNSILEVKQNLEGKTGDRIDFTLARQLSGNGVQGDTTLEGSEEAVSWFTTNVVIDQFRNAVRFAGRMSERRTAFDQRKTAKQLLKDWLAAFIDNRVFTTLTTSPTRSEFGGDATSTATIESGDYLTLALISRTKTRARKVTPQIFPVAIEGSDYFLLLVAPDVLYDLKTFDPAWAQAQREAEVRGKANPLFTGAEGVWDGVVIRSSTRVPLTTNWGSGNTLNGAENLFAGRQAGVFAWGQKPEWVEQSFDFGARTGFAIGALFEIAKATFNAQDNGSINVRTFRSNI